MHVSDETCRSIESRRVTASGCPFGMADLLLSQGFVSLIPLLRTSLDNGRDFLQRPVEPDLAGLLDAPNLVNGHAAGPR